MGQKPPSYAKVALLGPELSAAIQECKRDIARARTAEQMEAAVRKLNVLLGISTEPEEDEGQKRRRERRRAAAENGSDSQLVDIESTGRL